MLPHSAAGPRVAVSLQVFDIVQVLTLYFDFIIPPKYGCLVCSFITVNRYATFKLVGDVCIYFYIIMCKSSNKKMLHCPSNDVIIDLLMYYIRIKNERSVSKNRSWF